ncbi:MAG: hypothetical protein Phog2KO_12220 [Phototrophicaceae bacterium]
MVVLFFIQISVRDDLIYQRAQESLNSLTNQHDEILVLLDDVTANLHLLGNSPSVIAYINDPSDENRDNVALLFSAFASAKGTYDQVRLLSPEGIELVRVNYQNYESYIVLDEDLQDKSAHTYYQETINLGEGEIYISDLTLNRENGVIEEPHSPVLRYATPLFDDNGLVQSILILNLLPNQIFDVATQYNPDVSYYVTNEAEDIMYTSSNVSTSILYASDLNHSIRIQNLIPSLDVHSSQSGLFIDTNDETVITYIPLTINSGTQQRQWLLVSEQTTQSITLPINRIVIGLIVAGSIGLFISLFISLLIAYQIIDPLRSLYLASTNLHNRDWENSLRLTQITKSNDEIGELAKSFENTVHELRNFYTQLDTLVIERTNELEWANKQLKHIDLIKTSFIEDIAHDIRTPLASILLNTSMIKRTNNAPEKYVERIEKQAHRIKMLMGNVNMMTHVELSFSDSKVLQPIFLHSLILPIIEAHRTTIELANISLDLDIQPVPAIQGLQFALQQLFENLFTNAIKYTVKGKIFVSLKHENDVIELVVQDTGIGIAEEELPFVMERYYRSKDVRQSVTPGTGLGLSIVLEAIDLHEGKFDISSTLDVGTKITVKIPIHRAK